MKVLRTPDEHFASLPDFPYEPRYAEVDDTEGGRLRVAYVDEGPRDGRVVLLMHGEPTWSFLYRKMIPLLVDAGCRAIAPDLVGFGRSDKPAETSDYTYQRHVDWMSELVFEHLDLRDVTLFCQDWGGLIGLRLVAAHPDRFAGVVVSNTGMPTGEAKPTEAFLRWQQYSQTTPSLPIGQLVRGGTAQGADDATVAAYDAPFPDDSYKAGARIFPALVPTSPDDPGGVANQAAWETLTAFDRPFQCAFGDSDPVTKGGERAFVGRVAGAEGRPNIPIEGGGHFIQEDRPAELVRVILDVMASS